MSLQTNNAGFKVVDGKEKYTVSIDQYTALIINSFGISDPSGIPLKGQTINTVTVNWTLNKNDILSQTINAVSVATNLRTRTLTGLGLTHVSLLANRTFTLVVDDGKGQPGSVKTAQAVLTFGNYIYRGFLTEDLLNGGYSDNQIATFITGLTKTSQSR